MIVQADAEHIPYQDGIAQLVVTSPPYFMLRDYGGEWSGGNPACRHAPGNEKRVGNTGNKLQGGTKSLGHQHEGFQGTTCPLCGAKRIGTQIGLEEDLTEYISKLICVFREVRRVMRKDGLLFLNIGDKYANHSDAKHNIKPKDEMGIPDRLVLALQADGWYRRRTIIWYKPNAMPESAKDRPTRDWEYVYMLSRSPHYFFNYEDSLEPAKYDGRKDTVMKGAEKYNAPTLPGSDQIHGYAKANHERWPNKIMGTKTKENDPAYVFDNPQHHGEDVQYSRIKMAQEGTIKHHSGMYDPDGNYLGSMFEDGIPARHARSVWEISTQPTSFAHFATFPEELAEKCIRLGSRKGDIVFDPFSGSGTVERVCIRTGRQSIGTELNFKYINEIARLRISKVQMELL